MTKTCISKQMSVYCMVNKQQTGEKVDTLFLLFAAGAQFKLLRERIAIPLILFSHLLF